MCDPESESPKGGRWSSRANIIDGIGKKQTKKWGGNSSFMFVTFAHNTINTFPKGYANTNGGKTHARDMKRLPRALNAQEHQR